MGLLFLPVGPAWRGSGCFSRRRRPWTCERPGRRRTGARAAIRRSARIQRLNSSHLRGPPASAGPSVTARAVTTDGLWQRPEYAAPGPAAKSLTDLRTAPADHGRRYRRISRRHQRISHRHQRIN